MPRAKISEFSTTPGDNTDIDGINIAEGCAPSGINDAIRELMAQLKDFQSGAAGDNITVVGTLAAKGTSSSGADLKLYEDTDNGTNYVGFIAPASIASNVQWTLPSADGSSGQALQTNGSGTLSFATLGISAGGTGQTTANAAFNALAPSQTSNAGRYLKTDGTNTSWDLLDISTADITGTLPVANGGTGITSFGTGVATALGINVGSSGAFVTNGGALGTPSSGTVTNLTGTASININGTVGATTPNTGSFTTLTTSSTVTINGGTANGVLYLNGSKVATSGSALTFDGTNFGTTGNANLGSGSKSTDTQLNFASDLGTQRIYLDRGTRSLVFYDATTAIENYRIAGITGVQTWGVGGSEQMRLTSTGLGIGTSSPQAKLQVSATTPTLTGGYGQINVFSTDSLAADKGGVISLGGVTGFGAPFDPFKFAAIAGLKENATSGNFAGYLAAYTTSSGGSVTERLRIDSSGNLGLGVTPSAWSTSYYKVIEGGDSGNQGAVGFRTDVNGVELFANAYFNGTNNIYKFNGAAGLYQNTGGTHAWFTAASGTAGNTISFTQAMTLDASGNLGVGTTSPGFRVDFRIGSAGSIANFSDGTQNLTIGTASGGVGYVNGASGVLGLYTSSTERARITSGGDLLVGATSLGAWDTRLTLSSDTGTTKWGVGPYSTATNFVISASASAGVYLAGTTATSWSSVSDERHKDIIEPIANAAEKVCTLRAVIGKYKADETNTRKSFLIAQDVLAVLPEAVDISNPERFGLAYSDMVPLLVAAIQEQQALINDLRARVAQLEAK